MKNEDHKDVNIYLPQFLMIPAIAAGMIIAMLAFDYLLS